MSVRLAKKTGFCFGVKRAVRMAEEALSEKKKIHSLGSIIHNKQVVESLSRRGLKVIKDINELKKGVLVISSHGLSPKIRASIVKRGIDIIDTTCPFVLNAQKIAKRLAGEGYTVVIVGDSAHPEVRALVDFAAGRVFVVKDKREAGSLKLDGNDRVSIIAQTTQSKENFANVVKEISAKDPKELKVFDTICEDAESRQAQAKKLSRQVDLMLVVGGRNSANTKRLLDVCKKRSGAAYLIETEDEIEDSWLKKIRSVGITSGASTPDWIVKKVADRVRTKIKKEASHKPNS
ncbi:MAG: 4-hydroxy-3-methylbut-2-enyl diphosphate reductase [Candidatus Omnitrophica bacterium]|nr:4-hydroxy-3-methylbut-2-enyl diphosphate reductase [Candidatus Omnitrophota bacterium]MDD5437438.1 4-hydroxy-3-methylbut-2-enyl diphosphate reductase [Candidatus Omnitrophota bacterium]